MNLQFSFKRNDSGIHQLNPFVMPVWVAAILVAAMTVQHPVWLLAVFLTTVPVACAAGVARQWARLMKFVVWMFVAIVIINLFASQQGSHVLVEAGFRIPLIGVPRITVEALAFGGAMGLRLGAIISAFTLLNLCVHPDDLMRAAIKLRLPYRSVLVTSLSTRFIPVLMADAKTISDVQESRGLAFGSGNVVQRIAKRGALIFPLLSNSLDRAVQVAEAMESRAYGAPVKRTFYRDVPLMKEDVLAILALFAGIALLAVFRTFGFGAYDYYPSLGDPRMSISSWLTLGLICVALMSVVVAGSMRRRRDRDSI